MKKRLFFKFCVQKVKFCADSRKLCGDMRPCVHAFRSPYKTLTKIVVNIIIPALKELKVWGMLLTMGLCCPAFKNAQKNVTQSYLYTKKLYPKEMCETIYKYKLPVNLSRPNLAWCPFATIYYLNVFTFLQT